YTVGAQQQVGIKAQLIDVSNLGTEAKFHAELFAALLQNFQQPQARDSRKAVAVNRYLVGAVNHIDVVPGFKVSGDRSMRLCISSAQIRECLPGKNNSPTKRVIRPIALMDCDVMRSVRLLHQDGEIQSRRSAADDVDFHCT